MGGSDGDDSSGSSFQVWRAPDHVDLSDRRAAAADLAAHIRDFLGEVDVSPALVGHMETLLNSFEDADWHEDLLVPMASYEPWGGTDPEFLYSFQQLASLLRWALPLIDAEAAPRRQTHRADEGTGRE